MRTCHTQWQRPASRVPTLLVCSTVTACLPGVPEERRAILSSFIRALLRVYIDLHFVYLEINPLVVTGGQVRERLLCVGRGCVAASLVVAVSVYARPSRRVPVGCPVQIHPLDMAAKIDEAANFLCSKYWGDLEFPTPFGRAPYPEESYIKQLDSKTGASLKLTVLNKRGTCSLGNDGVHPRRARRLSPCTPPGWCLCSCCWLPADGVCSVSRPCVDDGGGWWSVRCVRGYHQRPRLWARARKLRRVQRRAVA